MRLRKIPKWEWCLSAPIIFLLALSSFAQSVGSDNYEDEDDINAKVARISFLRGETRVKRDGEEEDWQTAQLNLPIVEGDRIETDPNAALEIQFDTYKYLRIAGNSLVRVTTLSEEGIALSISEGTLSVRLLFFDKEKSFFEIDAPQTTVSIQKEGLYRIDAGNRNSDSVRITASEGGQARIYSQDAGFSIRSGRSAQVFIEGNMAGEWETSDASRYADEWDAFVAERDRRVRKSLDDAHYGKYYERDIYGAEDLNDYGEWIDADEYGKVWRPYERSTRQYANWSPYRYGSWQWVSPYGWTWVNDEPWGWATYHYGRWVSYRNTWVWCPYPANRGRTRWRPALVAITYIDRDIHWYPLCYHHDYYDYNRHYRRDRRNRDDHRRRDRRDDHSGHNRGNKGGQGRWNNQHSVRNIPPSAVVTMRDEDFGRRRGRVRPADSLIARRVLEGEPRFEDDSFRPERRRAQRADGNPERPRPERESWRTRTGAADRRAGVPMEREINDTRVFNDRRRIERRQRNENPGAPDPAGDQNSDRRDTGAVERQNRRTSIPVRDKDNETRPGDVPQPTVRRERPDDDAEMQRRREERRQREERRRNENNNTQPSVTTPPFNPNRERREEPRTQPGNETRREERREQPRNETRTERPAETPRETPRPPRRVNPDDERIAEPRREESRREQPRREEPRREERREEPRREQPRQETPRREEPRSEPRREAPRREEPRPEPKREERREEPREERRREEPRREEPKREQPKREEPKREEPKREEPRREQPKNVDREEVQKVEPPDNLMAALEGFFSGLLTFAGISGD